MGICLDDFQEGGGGVDQPALTLGHLASGPKSNKTCVPGQLGAGLARPGQGDRGAGPAQEEVKMPLRRRLSPRVSGGGANTSGKSFKHIPT